jgi:hypothetical protein
MAIKKYKNSTTVGRDYGRTPEMGDTYYDFVSTTTDKAMLDVKPFKHSEFKQALSSKDYPSMDTNYNFPLSVVPPWFPDFPHPWNIPGMGAELGKGEEPPTFYVFSCKWSGKPDTTIDYTTLIAFAGGANLAFSIKNQYHPGYAYNWVLTGDGTINAKKGSGVLYTPPASNENCTKSASLTLSCGAETCATVRITITSNSTSDAYAVFPAWNCTGSVGGSEYLYAWLRDLQYLRCDGVLRTIAHRCDGNCSKPGGGNSCGWTYTNCISSGSGCAWGGSNAGNDVGDGSCGAGKWDVRSAAMKLAGCCPCTL